NFGAVCSFYYGLCASHIGDAFWDMIPFVAQGTDQQLVPADAVCDFESALNDAVQRQF
ncbi:hypothetical protein L917_06690, partial [Phytophthora nicotianae]